MTPLNRAARALVLQESGTDSFDGLSDELQAQVIESVKAVLMAVEPSTSMVAAAVDASAKIGAGDHVGIWRAMRDAAIAED